MGERPRSTLSSWIGLIWSLARAVKNSMFEGTIGVVSFFADFLAVDSFFDVAGSFALGVFFAETAGCERTGVGSVITCSTSGSGATTSISLGSSWCSTTSGF